MIGRAPLHGLAESPAGKIDLAPYVGASLEVMDTDAKRMRGAIPPQRQTQIFRRCLICRARPARCVGRFIVWWGRVVWGRRVVLRCRVNLHIAVGLPGRALLPHRTELLSR